MTTDRAICLNFLKLLGFERNATLWFRIAWEHSSIPLPNWEWTATSPSRPVQYIFQAQINRQGNNFNLTRCSCQKTDRNGDKIWYPAANAHPHGFKYLRKLSELGASIYFYPNGSIINAQVVKTNCLFYEIDTRSILNQRSSINTLERSMGLTPAAVIFSGNKSLHVYYRSQLPLTPKQWLYLNRRLTVIQDSDPAICNLGRSMRLPGMLRRRLIKERLDAGIEVEVISWSLCQYLPTELKQKLETQLGQVNQEKWQHWLRKPSLETHIAPDVTQSKLNQYTAVPLTACLTERDRTSLSSGVTAGSRNTCGYKLARNLIATSEKLEEMGYSSYPSPFTLFERYCQNCTPALEPNELQQIWRNAKSKPASPSRSWESIYTSIRLNLI